MRRPAPSKPATAPSAAQTLQRAGFAPLVLEPRVLFDAAGVETAVDVAAQADGADPFVPDATPDAGLAEAAAAAVPPAAETTAAPVTATATAPAPTAASQDSRVLVFVDSRVADQSTLLAGLPSGAEVVQIDAGSDGLAQIASAVQGRTGLDAIHIVGHGASGEILLGDTRLDSVGLTTRAAELAGIGAALGADGDILLYGCDVGSGEAGAAFVSGLAAATGADVAASTDATGAAALGGDWELERSAGTVEAATLFTGTGGWEHRLAAISLSSSTAWIPVLVGPNHDPNNDTQANNADLDLVGNASNPLLYYQFDDGGTPSLTDGTLAYRFRVGDDSFGAVALVGVDADRDGDLDLFLSVDKAGGNASSHAVKIWAPGNGANNSPSTTSLTAPTSQKTYALTAANYLLSSTGSDLDGDGNTDSFVSFSLPFADVVSEMSRIANISINQNTVMQYVALTLTQTNSINGDIGGINGGSSSSTTFASLGAFSAPLSASNLFPTISATNSVNVAENTTTVATVAGTDADGDTLTYSITGGDDAAKFSVTSDGKLTFVSAPDFESPQDVGSNNTYIVKVTASDGKGGTAEQTITVTVTDAAEGGGNQAPTLGSVPANASYTEGGTAVAVFSGITVSDDGANLTGATVTIAANRESTDVLAFTNANGITGSYDSSTGTLTLTGTASKAAYETAIRAITFSSTSDNPSTSSRTVTVTVTDGSLSSTAGSTTVSVARSNDAPTIAAPASIGVTEDTATALTGISFSDADAGTAAVTVTLGVATGSLAATSGGSVTVGGSGTGTLTLTGSVANINSFIAASGVTFTTASNATSAVTLSVGIDDGGNTGGSAQTASASVTLNVTAQNDAPTVTGLSGATFNENTVNAAAQLIDTDITLADVDSADFDGGTLSVTYSVGGGAQDQLGIRNQGTAAGQIGVSGSSVTYGGVTIGTITATGANGGALTVSLNANATPAAVEALIENLTYANTSDTPTASRTISITVSDGDGGTSTAATAAIAVTAQNDAPTLTGLDNASFSVGDFATGSKLIDTAVVFSDPDGVALDGGTVTIGFTSGGATTDSLTIGESGTGTGTVSFNGTQVSFGGQVFGTVSGGTSGTDLQISLNGNATVAAVDALLQSIAYRSTAVTPAASRTVAFTVTDGAGGSTGAVSATIGISGAGNADPVIANTTAGQAVNDSGTVSPFSGVTLSDADSGTTLSVTVSLDDTAKGAFTSASLTSSGFTAESNGTYTFSGTVAAAQAALRALVFDPANDRKAVGSSETTTFTIAISDGSGGTDSDNVTTVVSTSVNDAPTLGGITSTTTINDTATATPFSSVTIADSDPSQTVTVTVTLDAAAKGALSGTSGTYDSKLGEWSFSGSAAAAQAAIRALSFNPTDNRVAPGSTETTTFTISVDDGVATAVTDGKTTVTSTSVNDAPTVTDTVASQAVNDSGTVSPFSGVTLSDVDPDTTLSVTVSLDDTAKGAFTSASLTSSGFTAESNGTYTFSGTVSAAQAALRALVFDPANDRKAVGSSETTTFTIAISDGSGGTDSDNVTTVVSTSVNDAPTITDTVADQQVNDSGTVNPFSGVTLSDLDPGTTLSVTVSLDDTAKGAFTSASLTSSGFTAESNGTYTYSGTVAAAQAALRALVFDPANDRKAVGSSETTTFTIAISDGSGGTDSDNVTTVVSTSVNDAPTLGGITATTTINDTATATPFSSVTIADSDPSQTVTVTVTLDSAAKGVLPDGKGSYDSKLGVWTFTGSAADAQAAIRALSFNPTDNRVAPGSTETTTFTISVDDGVATAVTDGKTTVISTSVNDAPTITDTVADQQVNDSGTVNPFSGVTLADVDPNTTLSVIVLLDDTAKGAFTSASLASSGFTVEGDGTYTFSGSVAAAQSALRALVFDPANNRKAVDGTETTTFTIAISDGSGGSDNDKVTTVISKSVNDAPTLGGITSTTTINDTATATPFSAVTIADSDPSQTVTVKVTLDAAAKGALSGTGGTYDSKLGEWTFTGSATDAQAAIRALSFNPTDNRVAPGSTETTTFTISVDDGVATAVTDGKTTVTSTSVNDAPTIADTVADQQVNDSGTVSPFSGVTLSDVDPDTTLSVTVSLDDTAKGAFTSASLTSSGFTAESNGTYTYSGTVAAAQAALRALVFDPANDRKAVGSTETTTFTIAISDGSGGTDSDNVTTVVSKSVNDAPTLGGITATTTINDTATATPFSSVTIADSDPGQTVTVKVTLDSAAKGVLPDGKGSYDSKAGVWTFTGSAADAQAAIRALSFNPTDNRVAPGSTETTTFTISVDDGVATAVTDGKTTVTSTSVNDAPVIAGTVADQAASDTGTVSPFAAVTLTDADPGATLSVTVSLDDAAKGVFTSASLTSSGFTAAGQGKYTFTGSAADAQAALRALVFDPTNDRVGVGQTETATFTIGVDDGDGGTDSDDTTSLVVNSDNSVPTLNLGGNGGGNTGVQIADVATVTPFTGATIADSDPGQSITVTVTLDDVAKGTLGGGGGSFDPSTGVWTFTGSAAAAEAALRALVFTPTPNRIAVGQTEAAGFTVAVSDGQADPVTATTTVNVLSINDAPSIVDTVAGQTVSDQGTIRPFTTTVIGDPDQPDQILQLTITLDDPAKGVFTDASLQASGFGTQASGLRRAGADALVRAGFVLTDAGYTRSGTSAELTAAVRALVFDPTDNRVAVGLTETTVFTLTVRDPSDGSAEDGTTSVVVLSLNDAPTVAGTVAGQTVLDNATLAPFAGATIGDADRPNQTLTLTVAQNDPALGQITSASLAAAGFTSGANGAFTRTGTAAELTAAIRQLVFDPVENRVAPGTTETAAFTLTVTDSEGATTTDATTTVTIRSANDGPMLGGLVAVPTLVATATTTPFAGATIADVDAGQTMTVTVRLDDNAKGVLTNLGGFVFSNGAYTMTGSAAAVQAALRGLVFDPADGRMAFGARETTAFTVTVSDGMASATGTVSVNAAMPEAPPPPAPPAPPPPPPPPPAPPPLPPAPTLIVTTAVPAVVAPPAPVTVGPANDAITAPPSLTRAVADLPSTLNAPTDQGADAGRNPVRSSGDGAGGRTAGLEVVGRVGNATVEVGEPLTLQVPRSVFRAADPQQTLVFEARKADGSPLPAWIKFDPATGTFSGRPPPGEEGLKLVVIARDTEGNEAATEFEIKVEQGGEPRPAGAQPPLSGEPAPQAEDGAAPAPRADAGQPADTAVAAGLAGRASLTAQLAAAGRDGGAEADSLLASLARLFFAEEAPAEAPSTEDLPQPRDEAA